MRGLAALAVVIFHYNHLTAGRGKPFEAVLGPVYAYGNHAVPLFFILSGYIFFAIYSDRIADRNIGVRDFAVARLSRLYPLHLVTLLIVAILQAIYMRVTGGFLIYRNNDALHFILNILMLQFGWFPAGFSFDGPAWSISVEVGLYVSFFLFCSVCGRSIVALAAVAAAFLALTLAHITSVPYGPLHPFMSEGLGCFFLGGCLRRLQAALPGRALFALGVMAMLAGAGLAFKFDIRNMLIIGVFPGLILISLASGLLLRVSEFRPLVALGEVSYSIYLWHFPVQIAFALFAAEVAGLDFATPGVFWMYIAATFLAGAGSHRWIEVPAKRAIRDWARGGAPAPAVSGS